MKEKSQPNTSATHERETFRLIGLSDGLFATVLTLLVLDLRIPDLINLGDGNLNIFIKSIGPHLFSYLLTFIVAGTYWIAHHRDFDLITHCDRNLLGYNLLFLLFIGLLPFSTAAMSLVTSNNNIYPFYWAIYAANIIFAGIMLTLTWIYAVSHGFVDANIIAKQNKLITMRQLVIPAIFVVSIGMEYIFPKAPMPMGPLTLLIIPLVLGWVNRSFTQPDSNLKTGKSITADLLWRAGSILPWALIIGLAVWAMSR
jgi:uncharacterized membrane protein